MGTDDCHAAARFEAQSGSRGSSQALKPGLTWELQVRQSIVSEARAFFRLNLHFVRCILVCGDKS